MLKVKQCVEKDAIKKIEFWKKCYYKNKVLGKMPLEV